MQIRKAFLFTACAALLSCVPVNAGTSQPLNNLIEHVKRAVVIVNAFDERGRCVSQGSGFFVASDRIITNLHVVGTAARVEIKTFDSRSYPIEGVVAFDEKRDLALLQIASPAPDVVTLNIEDSRPRTGEEIFVVSSPQGYAWQVSRGTTQALRDFQDIGQLVRITASISRGSSGGPVVNLRGRVVGVATMNLKAAEELYFAVPGERIADLRPGQLMHFPLQACMSND